MNETEQMLTYLLKCRRVDLYSDHPELSLEHQQKLSEMRRRRSKGEPLQYIIGDAEFMNFKLRVDNRVLIPRPETEILVEKALQIIHAQPLVNTFRILDLGTGSGNIAIALAKANANIQVTTVDLSQEALALAKENAVNNQTETRITFVHDDMREFLLRHERSVGKRFDMIISNPPYIPREDIKKLPIDVQKEPHMALDGGLDGMDFLEFIIENVHTMLKNYGHLLLEFGDDQRDDLEDIFEFDSGFYTPTFFEDYTETDRIVVAQKRG